MISTVSEINSTYPNPPQNYCQVAITSTPSFIFNLLILVFIPLSYVPQYHRIFTRKSTYGLSPYLLLFTTIASTGFLGSGIFQSAYTFSNSCCKEDPGADGGIHCYGVQMGVWQALTQWACCTGLFVLFYVYARAEEKAFIARLAAETAPVAPSLPSAHKTSLRAAKRISYTGFIHIFMTLGLFLAYVLHQPSNRSHGFLPDDLLFYLFLGYCSVMQMLLGIVFLSLQSVPQIITTLRMKRIGSLSIPTMCMQVPGYFVWAATLRGRYSSFLWVPMVAAGTLQGALLVLSLDLERKRKRDERTVRLTSYEDEEDWRGGVGQEAEDGHDGPISASPRSGPISL